MLVFGHSITEINGNRCKELTELQSYVEFGTV